MVSHERRLANESVYPPDRASIRFTWKALSGTFAVRAQTTSYRCDSY